MHDDLGKVSSENDHKVGRITPSMRKEAQAALLDYLHITRGFEFNFAENMSRHSHHFLGELIRKVNTEGDIALAITRFICYHPINEFEPFFESLGLKPCEYSPFLPRKLMFLADDELLLENYRILATYGIERNSIGIIYRDATEVFRYGKGVLSAKLSAYEELGLSTSFVARVVSCFPYLLTGEVNIDFVRVMEILKRIGIDFQWIEDQLSERNSSCNWKQSLLLLKSITRAGYSDEKKLSQLLIEHPEILFGAEQSVLLIGVLLKTGSSMAKIVSILQQFPKMEVGKFVSNLRQGIHMLDEIKMEPCEIAEIVHSHALLLGSCTLKKTKTLLYRLNIGKKRLRELIREDPRTMKNWVLGVGVQPMQSRRGQRLDCKTEFLLGLGYVENSTEMAKALKVFRGRGSELQERFDYLIEAGLDREAVLGMVKVSPHILNQSKDVTAMKIDFLVKEFGYPISCVVGFPSLLNFKVERIKLRLLMYGWLKDEGVVKPGLSLSNMIASSDSVFFGRYVEKHRRGPDVWQDLRNKIYGDDNV
ncbi:unnamed protein product [Linum trigynum]